MESRRPGLADSSFLLPHAKEIMYNLGSSGLQVHSCGPSQEQRKSPDTDLKGDYMLTPLKEEIDARFLLCGFPVSPLLPTLWWV